MKQATNPYCLKAIITLMALTVLSIIYHFVDIEFPCKLLALIIITSIVFVFLTILAIAWQVRRVKQ